MWRDDGLKRCKNYPESSRFSLIGATHSRNKTKIEVSKDVTSINSKLECSHFHHLSSNLQVEIRKSTLSCRLWSCQSQLGIHNYQWQQDYSLLTRSCGQQDLPIMTKPAWPTSRTTWIVILAKQKGDTLKFVLPSQNAHRSSCMAISESRGTPIDRQFHRHWLRLPDKEGTDMRHKGNWQQTWPHILHDHNCQLCGIF